MKRMIQFFFLFICFFFFLKNQNIQSHGTSYSSLEFVDSEEDGCVPIEAN